MVSKSPLGKTEKLTLGAVFWPTIRMESVPAEELLLNMKILNAFGLKLNQLKLNHFSGKYIQAPNSTIQWNAIFEDCMEHELRENKEIYLMGDINRDLLNNQIKNAWADYMEPFGLTQLVSEASE